MDVAAADRPTRRPRFRRAPEPPPFRLTDDDVEIVRLVARYRLIRSTHIAALIGRSLDRTNDRLMRLFHAGYIDRPRAQLDYYPTMGSAPMVYALADGGGRLLSEKDGIDVGRIEWSRHNREAGRPFIEHQIEIVNFQVAFERAVRNHPNLRILHAEEGVASSRSQTPGGGNAKRALRATLSHRGVLRETSVVPDLILSLACADGSRRHFMVEIDRGTMPVMRSDPDQTSFESKMRVYLAAYAAKQHERQFGWQSFRVLTITTDHQRMRRMQAASRDIRVHRGPGASLFLFATFSDLRASTPLACEWHDGNDRDVELI